MNRKTVGVVAALLCALVGVAILAAFARSSGDEAALDAQEIELVAVLRLTGTVSAGTAAADLEGRYVAEEVAATEASPERVDDVMMLSGMVAAVDLAANKILQASDFVLAGSYARPVAPISVAPELLQASITLEPQRVLGGQIRPGDEVAVFASFADGAIPADESALLARTGTVSDDGTPATAEPLVATVGRTTHLLMHQALVTNVQVESLPAETTTGEGTTALSIAPTGNFVVSLGLPVADMERLIFAMEYGTLWMALEPDAAVDRESPRVQRPNTIWLTPELPTTPTPEQ